LTEAFEQCANAMFHYMTEVDYIEMKESYDIEVEGHDMLSLLYNFLDELLFMFSAEPNYIARVRVILNILKCINYRFHLNNLIYHYRK